MQRPVHHRKRAPGRAGPLDQLRAIAAAALLFLAWCPSARTQGEQPSEYQLKAAFLFNFAKFVDWPAGSFANAQTPFTICVLGPDPFGRTLDDSLAGKTLSGRAIQLRRCQTDGETRSCQIVFVSRSQSRRLADILQGLKGTNVLLVGESADFAAGGGAIEFFLQDDRVRFRINPEAVNRAGLTVSSKLLALATIVHEGTGDGKS